MFRNIDKRGQSTLEYAILIAVIVGALLAIQIYVKRGVQGRFKQAADDIGEQYSPQASTYDYTTTSTTNSNENTVSGTVTSASDQPDEMATTTTDVAQDQTKTGTEYISNLGDNRETWTVPGTDEAPPAGG